MPLRYDDQNGGVGVVMKSFFLTTYSFGMAGIGLPCAPISTCFYNTTRSPADFRPSMPQLPSGPLVAVL